MASDAGTAPMAPPDSDGDRRPPRIAVVGGGITGLAAAHRLIELARAANRPIDLVLYEGSDRLGGVFGTRRVGESVVETGADSFITDKPWAIDLCRRLGLEPRLISIDPRYRRALILHRGRTQPVPDGLNLLAPSSVRGLLTTPILSLSGKLRAGLEFFVPRGTQRDDESLASFVRRRFGREMLERIAQPIVGGIYTADPEQLSLAATLPRFLQMERESGSLIRAARRARGRQPAADASGARYGLFVSLQDGMWELPAALAARIRADARIDCGRTVERLTRETSPPDQSHSPAGHCAWRLQFSDRSVEACDAVVLALPAPRAAAVVTEASAPLADALRQIEYASSAIVVTGHRLADVEHPLNAAGLVIPHAERRAILAVSFLSRKFPSRAPAGTVILRTFIGGALQPELLERTDDELTALALSELQAILGVAGRPEFSLVARYHRAMPQYHVGHLARAARIEQLAGELPGLELAGNALRGVGLPDCIHSGEQAAERLWPAVAEPAPLG